MSISVRLSKLVPILAMGAIIAFTCGAATAQTLATVKSRGTLTCGVGPGVVGFSAPSPSGRWTGFDVDFCRALAAAIFDDADKVTFVPLSAADRFRALQAGEIDILSRNSTWTMGREVELGLTFPVVTFYDGQGFMVQRARKLETALDLGGSKVCAQSGTTTALNVADYFNANGMKYEPVLTASADETVRAYDGGQCDTMTTDASALHSERLKLARPDDHVILPDIISKEPLGPAIRQGDAQWFNIVKWTHFAMLDAEELGVSSKTVDEALASQKPDVRRLMGRDGGYGEKMGLTNDWAVRIIRRVGNYAEVYERNVGTKTRLGIPRGINQLWTAGGIQYAPPIR
ncbi:amino acid ABC transporter substrate-binding protein [Astrobacterium formosum]|uniref:amino acid ABC transporter substrate-binding protein n=1 Tax=Astrobacterium formosum TaxID=3069710 RepID=UPI003F5044D5